MNPAVPIAASPSEFPMPETFYIVDGHYNAYRSFYALRGPNRLSAPDGRPTGAVFIFTRMLLSLIQKQQPNHIAFAFDPKGPTAQAHAG